MAKFECKCGNYLSNSINPEIEYRIYSDEEWIRIVEDESIVEPILIPYPKHTLWVCPKCERAYLWKYDSIDEDSSNKVQRVYIPEDTD